MKIYFARKKFSKENVAQIYEWEAVEKKAMYVITSDSAWFNRIRKVSVGMPAVDGAFGLTKEEAIDALKRGFEIQAEWAERQAAKYRKFLENTEIEEWQ